MKLSEFYWHRITPLHFLLWPISILYSGIISLKRLCYWLDLFPKTSLPVPVIVVDSITTEDKGKTPFILWLVDFLKARGLRPGIISRGFNDNMSTPVAVTTSSDQDTVGGKSLWLAHRCTQCPVWIGDDRVAVAEALLKAHPDCNILINDDGLQYHQLERDLEIVAIDYCEQNIGNGQIIPAGPLRESLNRLQDVDAVVINGKISHKFDTDEWASIYNMNLTKDIFCHSLDARNCITPAELSNKRIHAVADLDNAQWFFDHLLSLGITAEFHTFADNHRFEEKDFKFPDTDIILMSEEDAFKARSFTIKNLWVLPVEAHLDGALREVIIKIIREKFHSMKLINILACPSCKGSLRYGESNDELICQSEKLAFPIIDGIPVMQKNMARDLSNKKKTLSKVA